MKSNYALRLQSSLMDEVRKVAEEEGTTINQFINVAVAEKLAVMRTAQYFAERAADANPEDFMAILRKSKGNLPPREGDEILPPLEK